MHGVEIFQLHIILVLVLREVHLKLEFNWDIVPIYNVIARMPGRELPDQWIIRGNHHDAWVNGATDPISGMVALMEEARVDWRTCQNWMAAKTHFDFLRMGCRRARTSWLD